MLNNTKWLTKAAYIAITRPKQKRKNNSVLAEYSRGWSEYSKYLDSCESLDDWLFIKGIEDVKHHCQISGQLKYQVFDSGQFNKNLLIEKINKEFKEIKSITEYGCGIGRNLLFLKKQFPNVDCYGYELCQPGVDLARKAAKRFNLDVNYSQLDYVNSGEEKYIFPPTDIAFTMYSLEQLPDNNKEALINILNHTKLGSIHLEPSPENYPFTARGLIGKLNHWKVNYLKNLDRNISSLRLKNVYVETINTAHNPLMYPSIYILKK